LIRHPLAVFGFRSCALIMLAAWGSAAFADSGIDSTLVAFELRQELTDSAPPSAAERLDLSLARIDGSLASSLTVRIPLDAQPAEVDIASGHLVWEPRDEPVRTTVFFGENRVLAANGQIRLVDFTDEWANMQGMRFLYDHRMITASTDDGDVWRHKLPDRISFNLATVPGQERTIACLRTEDDWQGSRQRLTWVRVTRAGADALPDSSDAAAAAVWSSEWVFPVSRLPFHLGTEMGYAGSDNWAAAVEARDFVLRGDFAQTSITLIPAFRWTTPGWRSPAAETRSGRREFELALHASSRLLNARLLLEQAYAWHTYANPAYRIEGEVGSVLSSGITLRLRARSIRDTQRTVTRTQVPALVEHFPHPTLQNDLLLELRTTAASSWSRTQLFRSWLDRTSSIGMEWGTRITPTMTVLVRLLASTRDHEESTATAHTIILQASPQPLLSLELQLGSSIIGSRGILAEDTAIFAPNLERNGVGLVLRGAFH
jgi:hypothetical protein